MTTLWAFLLVLSSLILVHEFGHFLAARALGVRVLRFSIGFGPRLAGFVKAGTDWCVSLVPLGGYVKMLGEEAGEEVDEEDIPASFSARPVSHRALIVAAGPFSNILFAWLIFYGILLAYGNPVLLPVVGEVREGSPAARAGISPGDRIVAVDGRSVETWDQVSELIRASGGRPLGLVVERNGRRLELRVRPEVSRVKNIFGEEVEVPLIGVTAKGELSVERVGPFRGFVLAFERTWGLLALTAKAFLKIVQRVVPLSALGGPIMIAQMAGQEAALGLLNLLYFIALLSVNLGILNLFPIPVLDGGHLMLFGIETVTGRPLTMRQRQLAQQVGLFILGLLMLVVFYNDIARLVGELPAPGGRP